MVLGRKRKKKHHGKALDKLHHGVHASGSSIDHDDEKEEDDEE